MNTTSAVRELLRRAVLTLAAVPDPDIRYRLGPKSGWPPVVRDTRDAYGSAPPNVREFQPTRQDLTVYLVALEWLNWYEREWGKETVRLFIAWSFGAAMWQLQERVRTNRRRPGSPNTVHNRINGMVSTIAERFPDAVSKSLLDELRELPQKAGLNGHGREGVSTDARDLPKTPRTWAAPPDVTLTAKELAASRRELERRLTRNKSRALRRSTSTQSRSA